MYWIKLKKGELDRFNLSRLLDYIDPGDGFVYHCCIVTGDGHAHPSFGWIDSVPTRLRDHILDMVKNDVLCAHVEKLHKNVTHSDLPQALRAVHTNGKLFGWEVEIWEYVEPLLQEIMDVVANDTLAAADYSRDLRLFYQKLTRVWGFAASIDKVEYFRRRIRRFDLSRIGPLQPDVLKVQLMAFYNELMELRTDRAVHRATANGINAKMKLYKNCSHLISIGNAHLIHNNFCKFLESSGTSVRVGVVDIYTGGAEMVF